MAVNKIVTKVDGTINKTIDFNDLKSGLSAGAHTITAEAWNGATLVSTQTKNITIAAGAAFEAETTAFMQDSDVNIPNDGTVFYSGTPQETSGANLWTFIDDFIKREKTAGRWVNILYFRPRIKGITLAHAVNLKNPTTFKGVYYGSWIHNELGSTGNGANTYMTTGFNPSIEQVSGQSGMGAVLSNFSTALTAVMGCRISDTNASEFFTPGSGFDFLFRYNNGAVTLSGTTPNLYGVQIVNKINTTSTIFYNGIEKVSGLGTNPLQNLEMYEGKVNGRTGLNLNGRLGCTFQVSNFTDADCIDFSASVEQLELDLKRKTW